MRSARRIGTCKLNPNARIPTIDDDGFVMWESAAINFYLARKYRSPLLPRTVQGEGQALQWAFFIANDVEPPMTAVFQHRFVFPPEKRDPAIAAEADQRLRPKLEILDRHLARNRFFGGDQWDLADFMVASVTYSLAIMNYDLSSFPQLASWLTASLRTSRHVGGLEIARLGCDPEKWPPVFGRDHTPTIMLGQRQDPASLDRTLMPATL